MNVVMGEGLFRYEDFLSLAHIDSFGEMSGGCGQPLPAQVVYLGGGC